MVLYIPTSIHSPNLIIIVVALFVWSAPRNYYSVIHVLLLSSSFPDMGTGGSKEIALRLRQNGDTRVINLEGRTLDDEAIDVLVEVLRDPHVRSTVRCLRLGGCGLDGYRLQRIAEALVIANEPTHLKRLELVGGVCVCVCVCVFARVRVCV